MTIPSPDRGKRELVWEIACGTLLLVGIGVDAHFRTGASSAIGMVGRPFIFAALGALAFEGRAWAPKVAGVWLGLLAIVGGVNGIPAIPVRPIAATILFAVVLVYLLIAYRLIMSPHIRSFASERAARRVAANAAR